MRCISAALFPVRARITVGGIEWRDASGNALTTDEAEAQGYLVVRDVD
jgi:hypothetical protein